MCDGSDDGDDPDLEWLVRRIAEGDRQAEDRLAAVLYRPVFQMMVVRTRYDEHLARDLTQDTWIILLEKLRLNKLREGSKVRAFAHGIAKNVWLAQLRTQERRATQADTELIEGTEDSGMGPDGYLECEQLATAVDNLLKELNASRDEEVLRRYYLQEESKPEICKALGLSSSVFDNVLYRAKKRLRREVERSGVFDPDDPEGAPA